MRISGNIKRVFKILSDKHAYFDDIETRPRQLIGYQLLVISVLAFLTGLVMGSHQGMQQAISSGVKLVSLFLLVMVICFPSFYIIQRVLGSKLKLAQMTMIVMSGFILSLIIILSFAPIIAFFMFTGSSYHFLQLLHVAIFIFGGFWGLRLMVDSLKYACETKNVYPQTGVTVFKVWIVVLAFVSMQLAWNLRPFLGEKNEEFKLFRKYKGNFYTAVIYSFQQLGSGHANDTLHYDETKNSQESQSENPANSDESGNNEDVEPVDVD